MRDDQTQTQAVEAAPRKLNFRTLLILAVVLLLEVGTVVVTFLIAGGPSPAQADRSAALDAERANRPVEELVIQARFENSKRGDQYLYDTEIYVIVKQRNREHVKEQIKSMSARIHADVAAIFRRAEPSYMHEDELQTLGRQIKGMLDEMLGKDAEGESVVQRVLITRCTEYRADL